MSEYIYAALAIFFALWCAIAHARLHLLNSLFDRLKRERDELKEKTISREAPWFHEDQQSAEDMARLEKAIKDQAQVNRPAICNCPTCKRIKTTWQDDKFAGDEVKLERKS